MGEFDKRREREEIKGTDEIMKRAREKAKEDAEKNKELCTLKSLTVCGDDLDTLKKCLPQDDSGIITHIITMVEEHINK